MGTGYTRNDTSNNIADGNIINAADFDGEYNAIEAAFNASTGHTHDGTAAEGAPITVLGPSQEFVASSSEVKPSTNAGLDLGTNTLKFKDLYLDGTAYIDGLGGDILAATDKKIQFRDTAIFINSSADGQLDIDADTTIELNAPTVSLTDNLKLASDAAVLYLGADDDVTLTHNPDVGIDAKAANGFNLRLQTSDSTIESGNAIGKILFNAPDEASGTDAVVVGAAIEALAEATFDSSTNSTALSFKTATSSAATERMRITSAGLVGVNISNPARNLSVNSGAASGYIQLVNTNSGTGANQGFELKLDSAGAIADIINRENGALRFWTNNSERMRIEADGDIGVNTASINVHGWTKAITLDSGGASQSAGYELNKDGVKYGAFAAQGDGRVQILNHQAYPITFNTNGSERMRILSTGQIGINTDSPNATLHIADIGSTHPALLISGGGDDEGDFAVPHDENMQIGHWNETSDTFTSRLHINTSGDVGVGTVSPTSALHVYNATSLDHITIDGTAEINRNLRFSTAGSQRWNLYANSTAESGSDVGSDFTIARYTDSGVYNGAPFFIKRSTGNVGIGTTSPSGVLHVSSGTSGDAVLIIESDTDNNNESDTAMLRLQQDGGATITNIGLEGNAGELFTGSLANATYMVTEGSTAIQFGTNDTSRMVIKEGGNVGIGTNAPDGLLHVYNDVLTIGSKTGDTSIQQNATALRIKAIPNSSTEWGGVQWYREFSDTVGATIAAERPSSDEADTDLKFKTATSSSGPSEHMRITHNGRIGIGTPEPEVQLDIRHIPTTGGVHRPVKIRTDDPQNNVNFAQYDGVGLKFEFATNTSGSKLGASIDVIKENEDDTNTDTAIEFRTSDNDETLDLAMHISSARNVHINGRTALTTAVTNDNSGPSLIVEDGLATSMALFRNDASIASGNSFGSYAWYGSDTTSNTPKPMAAIQVRSMAAHTAGDTPTRMAFYTIPDNTETLNQNMVLDPDKLEVRSNGDMDLVIQADLDNVTETHNPRLLFRQDGAVTHLIMGVDSGDNVAMDKTVSNGSYINASSIESGSSGQRTLALGTNDKTGIFIDENQFVTMPKNPAFHAFSTAAYEIDGGGDVELSVNTAQINRGNDFAVSGNRFTAPVAGLYMFHMHMSIYDNDASSLGTQDDSAYITFKKNGTELGRNAGTMSTMFNAAYSTVNGVEISAAFSAIIDLSASDYVEIEVGDLSASRDYFVTNINFIGYMIG